jgi:hypothetical protein
MKLKKKKLERIAHRVKVLGKERTHAVDRYNEVIMKVAKARPRLAGKLSKAVQRAIDTDLEERSLLATLAEQLCQMLGESQREEGRLNGERDRLFLLLSDVLLAPPNQLHTAAARAHGQFRYMVAEGLLLFECSAYPAQT